MSKIKQLAGQVLVYGLGTMFPRLLNFAILTPYFTRVFTKQEYGVITELYAYIVVLQILLTYGMETGYFRFSVEGKEKEKVYSNILTLVGLTSLLFCLASFFWGKAMAQIIGYSKDVYLIRMVALIVAFDAFTAIPFARLRQEGKALKFALLKLSNILITLLLVFFFLSWVPEEKLSNWAAFIGIGQKVGWVFLANLVASGLMLFLLLKELGSAKIRLNRQLIGPLFLYSFPVLIAGLGGSVNEALDRIMLKHLLASGNGALEQLGIYGANYKIAVLMTLFIQMFRYASEPFFFGNMNEANARQLYSRIMNYFVIVCVFIFIGIMLFIDVVQFFIGSEFRSGIQIVPIVLFANMLVGIYFNMSVWYKLNKMTYIGALLMILGAGVTIFGNILLVPRMGYMGSAWTHVITYSVMLVFCYLLGRRFYPIDYNLSRIGLYLICGLGIYAIGSSLSGLPVGIIIAVKAFMVFVFIALVLTIEKELRHEFLNRLLLLSRKHKIN